MGSVIQGPIVRINSNELHISDPHFYNDIYAPSVRKVDKDVSMVAATGMPTSVVATINHDHHRARRGYLSPYFSARAIFELASVIHERVDSLCKRLQCAVDSAEVINLNSAFSALTADIITQHFYGEHFHYIGIPDLKIPIREAVFDASFLCNFARSLPGLAAALRRLPAVITGRLWPAVAEVPSFQEQTKRKILSCLKDRQKQIPKSILSSMLGDPEAAPTQWLLS